MSSDAPVGCFVALVIVVLAWSHVHRQLDEAEDSLAKVNLEINHLTTRLQEADTILEHRNKLEVQVGHLWAHRLVAAAKVSSDSVGINVDAGTLERRLRDIDLDFRNQPMSWLYDGHRQHLTRCRALLSQEIACLRDQALEAKVSPDKLLLEVRQLEAIVGKLPKNSYVWYERGGIKYN